MRFKTVLLDIETTGLNFRHDMITTINIVVENKFLFLTNSFDREYDFTDGIEKTINSKNEKEMIETFLNLFKEIVPIFVTFNGLKFDIPFLQEKINKYNLNYNLYNCFVIDLHPISLFCNNFYFKGTSLINTCMHAGLKTKEDKGGFAPELY